MNFFFILGIFITVCFTSISCKSKQRRVTSDQAQNNLNSTPRYSNISGSPISSFSESNVEKTPSPSKADPKDLYISRLSVANIKIGDNISGKIMFGLIGNADYIHWKACKVDNPNFCKEGKTTTNNILLKLEEEGKYEVIVRACINDENIEASSINCSLGQSVEWFQNTIIKNSYFFLQEELDSQEIKLKEPSEKIFDIIKSYQNQLQNCNLEGKSQYEILTNEINTQLENIYTLGSLQFSSSLSNSVIDPDDNELANIIETTSEEIYLKKEKHQIEGLSLSQKENIDGLDTLNTYLSKSIDHRYMGDNINLTLIESVIKTSCNSAKPKSFELWSYRDKILYLCNYLISNTNMNQETIKIALDLLISSVLVSTEKSQDSMFQLTDNLSGIDESPFDPNTSKELSTLDTESNLIEGNVNSSDAHEDCNIIDKVREEISVLNKEISLINTTMKEIQNEINTFSNN